ncbi:diaminopropionate ammonia-lyase [candidate division KSB1 bacterium]|nr:MAG: diaminopropionate ammonia-lyase [candidate division KSB1 bacterium]
MITHQLNLNNSRNRHANRDFTSPFSPEVAATVRTFHRSFPDYSPTPLAKLSHLAQRFGLANLWVKDESQRFGLNAFKVLGASYAIAHVIAQKDRQLNDEVSFALFQQAGVRAQLRETTLATATDGNHGRAVAWAAQKLGCQAVIYMPRDTASARVAAVTGHGAQAVKIDGSYDEAVHLAAQHAEQRGWILVQDTAWPGYEEIPTRIMQGYLTILHEACEQMAGDPDTHFCAMRRWLICLSLVVVLC